MTMKTTNIAQRLTSHHVIFSYCDNGYLVTMIGYYCANVCVLA